MDELNMRFPILHHTSERLLRNVAIVLIAGFGAGCSADTMRFTDGIFTGSTNGGQQRVAQQPSADVYASSAPIAPAPRVSSGRVQRSSLSPVSSAPLAAPVAAAREPVQPPAAAAQSRIGHTQDMAASHVHDAGVKMASAGSVAHTGAIGAKEKVLGQLPATPARPTDNNMAVLPKAPAVKGNKPASTDMAAAGPKAANPPSHGGYTVQSGDSIFSIAKKHNITTDELKRANGLSNGAIRVGQSLVIPAAGAASAPQMATAAPAKTAPAAPAAPAVVQNASISPEAANVKPYTPPAAAKTDEGDADKSASTGDSSQLRWPLRGRVLAGFGQRDGTSVNDGIDIMAPEGTPVKAADSGVVIYAGDGLKEFGQTVLIRHDNGLVTVYGHNSQILVQRGQKVRRGEEIAKSGMSGSAKSPKLHFEVRKNSTPVNPTKYLES